MRTYKSSGEVAYVGETDEQRFYRMTEFDKRFGSNICGVDEAGRGPLAGPVTVCACVLPPNFDVLGINDSKKLSEQKREELFDKITAVATYCVVSVPHDVIDKINILEATRRGMKQAIEGLSVTPDHAVIDAVKLLDIKVPYSSVIKADAKSYSVAAASVIAKVTRDRYMRELDKSYPGYGFINNKGYGTSKHIEALKTLGPCPEHRKTYIRNFIRTENLFTLMGEEW